ncbi:hypothetical protein CPB84DRAFT_1846150 [Gymnopilus junonius]|uniref:Methyltransferase domain-containing protein n=1 Tax=Gymnopilus junonius TaxID=109634 RepID=A0A9P5TQ22_GYMJU|nr:hypothetical protein CPB84DRAFT_1846150 [Gymnopilus junonius]
MSGLRVPDFQSLLHPIRSFPRLTTVPGALAILLPCIALAVLLSTTFRPHLKFIWHCFFRPLGQDNQKANLDKFYRGQAEVYDTTRSVLLRGRHTMLSLGAAHLHELRASSPNKRLVWIDIGGGTGYNIEIMDKHFPISSFDAVYLIDLCDSLLDVARRRFARKGWKNVHVLCQDASEFSLPEWSELGIDPKGSVSFVTMSYSLSMIPSYYTVLDRVEHVLSHQDGLLGVADFYTAGKQGSLHEKTIGGLSKECGWLSRWFWQIWFDFDHVHLGPARRSYLEYKFGTVKSYNGRNKFFLPFIVRIPYYIWLGRPRSCDITRFCHAFEVDGGNMIGNCSPSGAFKDVNKKQEAEADVVPPLDISDPVFEVPQPAASAMIPVKANVINITPPLSSFHYQVKKPWRLPYYEQPVHKEFRTFIYSFTWEDPFEDMKVLDLTSDDSMLVITSAGDNALHYAIAAGPKRIHCVDMNPCQGHLLELKLAAIQSLTHSDFYQMFGQGAHSSFRNLLDSRISPHISSSAYQFWRLHSDAFSSSFYMHGYSGLALRLAKIIFTLAGVTKDVEALCDCDTLEEQREIWHGRLRPVLLNPIVVAFLKSPVFCWNALGVPLNQRQMILEEGTFYDYVKNTLDPLADRYLFKTGSYFYLLALLGHYTPSSCPLYLTPSGFDALKKNDAEALDSFRLHTDSIVNVLRGLSKWSLTRTLVMDHLDWFSPGAVDVDQEIQELHRVTAPGGLVFWRSASKEPWYNKVFEKMGFKITPVAVRNGSEAIDMVNMYRSFWRAQRL